MRHRELPLLFAIFLDLVGFGMVLPDVQLRAEQFGAPGWLIGVLLASYFAVQLVVSPRWGRLSDRIGRKPVLLACTALSALSMVVYAVSVNSWLILAARVLAGFAAANTVVAQAYVADHTPDGERAGAMGRVSAAILVGLVLGPALGGWLSHEGGHRLMGLVAAGASALSLVWIAVAVKGGPPSRPAESRKGGANLRLLRELPALTRVFLVATVGWFTLACLEGTFARLINRQFGYDQREFGFIFSYESLLGAFVGLLLAWLSRRLSELGILRLGYVLQGVGLGLTPLAPWFAAAVLGAPIGLLNDALGVAIPAGLTALFLASTIYAFGIGMANPTINSVCSGLTPPDRQGELFGLLQAARSVGFLAGPILGGVLFDWVPESPYFVAAGVSLFAAMLIQVPRASEHDGPIAP